MNYLTEAHLGIELTKIFPNYEFIHNKHVPNSNIKNRPDYRCEELKLIIEFDGYMHYNNAIKIKTEQYKNIIYENMGYSIIRIPYFIQLSSIVIHKLFNINYEYNQLYPHGFIDEKALLPADFCELGILKFIDDLNKFNYVYDDIINSLNQKLNAIGDIDYILPPSIQYLLKPN